MNEFETSMAEANQAFAWILGQRLTVVVYGVETELPGILTDPIRTQNIQGFEFRATEPYAHFPDPAAFFALEAAPGDIVRNGTDEYRIVGQPERDDGGMIRVLLQKTEGIK